MEKKTFNLNDTNHESGIIIYDDDGVFVANWLQCGDNELPALFPGGIPFPWPYEGEYELVEVNHFDDVRPELPGTVWLDGDKADTDMDIIFDANGDISALWGIRTGDTDPAIYQGAHPYSGTVWLIKGLNPKIITLDNWG